MKCGSISFIMTIKIYAVARTKSLLFLGPAGQIISSLSSIKNVKFLSHLNINKVDANGIYRFGSDAQSRC